MVSLPTLRSAAAVCALLLAPMPALAATLTFLSDIAAPSGVGFSELEMSPDGKHLYAYSGSGGDLVAYSRDAGTGALTLVDEEALGVISGFPLVLSADGTSVYAANRVFSRDVVTGELDSVQILPSMTGAPVDAVSPDGEHAYSATITWGIGIWDRDTGTGEISLLDLLDSPSSFKPDHVAISADGAHVYVPDRGEFSSSYEIRAFARDAATGALQTVQVAGGGSSRYPLPRAGRVYLSPDQANVYVMVSDHFGLNIETEIAVFRRDPVTGLLSFIQHLPLENCLSSDRACCRSDTVGLARSMEFDVSGTRAFVISPGPIAGEGDPGVTILGRDPSSGALTFLEIQTAGTLGSGTGLSGVVSPDGLHFYMGTYTDTEALVETFAIGPSPASPLETTCKVEGKSLTIRNVGPGGLLDSAKVISGDATLLVPPPGSVDDPTCNGDAPGTVRATMRFRSDSSGQDTGEIDLPCENWSTLGKLGKLTFGYRYRDRLRASGPCSDIKLLGTKLLKAICDSKGVAAFGYDLTEGVDEGVVSGVLATATMKYCASFDDHKGKNGSDGKKFLGKSQPAPLSCP